MARPNFMEASRHAAELARWAMFHDARNSNSVTPHVLRDLEQCAEALGFKVVKADDVAVVMSR